MFVKMAHSDILQLVTNESSETKNKLKSFFLNDFQFNQSNFKPAILTLFDSFEKELSAFDVEQVLFPNLNTLDIKKQHYLKIKIKNGLEHLFEYGNLLREPRIGDQRSTGYRRGYFIYRLNPVTEPQKIVTKYALRTTMVREFIQNNPIFSAIELAKNLFPDLDQMADSRDIKARFKKTLNVLISYNKELFTFTTGYQPPNSRSIMKSKVIYYSNPNEDRQKLTNHYIKCLENKEL